MSAIVNQVVPAPPVWRDVVATTFRLLTFRASQGELNRFTSRHLALGVAFTWLAGVGRYWDNPRASLLQHFGLGSVIYIFLLSLWLWLVIWPLRPKHWSYFRVLTFVSLVSPPALLYAIPVEYFFPLETANNVNAIFLAVVATWRVALLLFFLRRAAELNWGATFIAALLPISLIVVTLTLLNLERVVFDLMRGIIAPSANDDAYLMLLNLTYFSLVMFIPILICYLGLVAAAVTGSRGDAKSNQGVFENDER